MYKLVSLLPVFLICTSYTSSLNETQYILINQQGEDLKASMERGAEIYEGFCMQCHLAEGEGVPNTYPPLKDSDWLQHKRKESIHVVKYGQNGLIKVNGKPYNSNMPAPGLEDEEVADVLNYIMNSWGNSQEEMVTVEEVQHIEK